MTDETSNEPPRGHTLIERDEPTPFLSRLTGSQYHYDYTALEATCPEAILKDYVHRTRAMLAPRARAFDGNTHTEWVLRHYLALKFILHATIMATSARYSHGRNVQISVPYLIYYMLFNACRAFLMTCPEIEWEGATTARLSHARAIERTGELLKRLDTPLANDVRAKVQAAKDQREMFSYHFPMSGFEGEAGKVLDLEDAIHVARVLAELAQLNSACLEGAVNKHGKPPFGFVEAQVEELMRYARNDGPDLVDRVDQAWLRKLMRMHTAPAPVIALVTEGMTEDFFGAWCGGDAYKNGDFDPDDDWRTLLHLW